MQRQTRKERNKKNNIKIKWAKKDPSQLTLPCVCYTHGADFQTEPERVMLPV